MGAIFMFLNQKMGFLDPTPKGEGTKGEKKQINWTSHCSPKASVFSAYCGVR